MTEYDGEKESNNAEHVRPYDDDIRSKQEIVSLGDDHRLYANLYVACQPQWDLQSFFSHENHSYSVAVSEYGKLRKCSAKSDFLKCLQELMGPIHQLADVNVKVIDGAAFVNQKIQNHSDSVAKKSLS
jgi:hypothetical protein